MNLSCVFGESTTTQTDLSLARKPQRYCEYVTRHANTQRDSDPAHPIAIIGYRHPHEYAPALE